MLSAFGYYVLPETFIWPVVFFPVDFVSRLIGYLLHLLRHDAITVCKIPGQKHVQNKTNSFLFVFKCRSIYGHFKKAINEIGSVFDFDAVNHIINPYTSMHGLIKRDLYVCERETSFYMGEKRSCKKRFNHVTWQDLTGSFNLQYFPGWTFFKSM